MIQACVPCVKGSANEVGKLDSLKASSGKQANLLVL